MPARQVKLQPSHRGEVIAFLGLILTALVWFARDRQDKGYMQHANETLERRVESLETSSRTNCRP